MTTKVLTGPKVNHTITSTLGEFFFGCGESFTDRTCQIDADLDKSESYFVVKQKSTRVAIALKELGVTSEDVIVVCAKVTLDTIIPILATSFLGAKIANLDPSQSERQVAHLLSIVSPKVIFTNEDSISLLEHALKKANLTADLIVFGDSARYPSFTGLLKPKSEEASFRPVKVDVRDTAVIFFSSGTTGLPKAICHSSYSFLHITYSFHESNCHCHSALSFSSFYWISAMILLTTSFISGGHRIICAALEAEKVFQTIDKYKVSFIFMAPILTYKLTNFERCNSYDTSSLRFMVLGGTPISSKQLLRLSEIFIHANVIFAYGLTEVGIVTMFDSNRDKNLISKKLGSCGRAAPGTTLKIVDLECRKLLGVNQRGEVCVKTDSAMKGYYKKDSSLVFDDDGFLKTGDIGYYDEDDCFYVIERSKEMFKYLSWHIVPSAIEAVLLEHPAIGDAAVFGVCKSKEEGEVPTACVVLKKNCNVKGQEIEEFVAERVSNYEKLRGGVFFVKELMKTPSGKLMRNEIRSTFLNTL